MKCAYVVLLLASLLGTAQCLFKYYYYFRDQNLSWDDALAYCRNNFVNLISLRTSDNAKDFRIVISSLNLISTSPSWMGLRKEANMLVFTKWSDGTPVAYTNWNTSVVFQSNIDQCGTMLSGDQWGVCDCTTLLTFYCYDWVPKVILVNELMTWDEALNYCRTFYTDLVSLTTKNDSYAANSVLDNQNTRVWTGLRYINSIWFWSNNQPLGNLVNPSSCPAFPFRCGALVPGTTDVENRDCMEKRNFVCYNKKVSYSRINVHCMVWINNVVCCFSFVLTE